VFFEAPHRVIDALTRLHGVFDQDKEIGVGRELTKAHEELVVQPISDLLERFSEPRGEFTFLVPPDPPAPEAAGRTPPVDELRDELGQMTEDGAVSRRSAVKRLAARYGVAVNELYAMLQAEDDDAGHKT
jgi:16S rRNA (cytidine1402-2'-O)-methyltransferase